ncbi:MAG: hypothetical protein IPI53_10340 [Saprospiraceae bacterium]|nr:hypothetical protein [Saprospiraceae bacterium]
MFLWPINIKDSYTSQRSATNLGIQTTNEALVIDFKYFNKISKINLTTIKEAMVQPGNRDQLNAEIVKYGLHFAPDLGQCSATSYHHRRDDCQ